MGVLGWDGRWRVWDARDLGFALLCIWLSWGSGGWGGRGTGGMPAFHVILQKIVIFLERKGENKNLKLL